MCVLQLCVAVPVVPSSMGTGPSTVQGSTRAWALCLLTDDPMKSPAPPESPSWLRVPPMRSWMSMCVTNLNGVGCLTHKYTFTQWSDILPRIIIQKQSLCFWKSVTLIPIPYYKPHQITFLKTFIYIYIYIYIYMYNKYMISMSLFPGHLPTAQPRSSLWVHPALWQPCQSTAPWPQAWRWGRATPNHNKDPDQELRTTIWTITVPSDDKHTHLSRGESGLRLSIKTYPAENKCTAFQCVWFKNIILTAESLCCIPKATLWMGRVGTTIVTPSQRAMNPRVGAAGTHLKTLTTRCPWPRRHDAKETTTGNCLGQQSVAPPVAEVKTALHYLLK